MISQHLQAETSIREISRLIGVAHSTVSREICRNLNNLGRYRYNQAQKRAEKRRRNCRKTTTIKGKIEKIIVKKLKLHWNPEQISGRFRREKIVQISHQAIYNFIRKDRENGGDLYKYLRRKRSIANAKTNTKAFSIEP